ncbi:MAG: diguanylate cyclase [Anaerolineales bacterium]
MTQASDNVLSAGGQILIADDDPDFRRLLVHRAERMGLNIFQAEDGRLAMEALEKHPFDVLVLDLYMPHNTGIEVFQAARKRDPEVQALVLTGNASIESAVDALRAGAYDYMMKPLESLAVFELSLTRALEHRHLLRENARLFAEVQRLAMTDPLTGLYNRHKLNESLGAEVERGLRYDRPLSAIMVDLDDLKEINDRYGHPVGDEVLRHVARGIKSQVRRVDIATRYGGDEFLVILPEADRHEAEMVASRIAEEIDQIKLEVDPSVSASIGVAQLTHDLEDADQFLNYVDQALYEAKRAGGGCIRIASSTNGHS